MAAVTSLTSRLLTLNKHLIFKSLYATQQSNAFVRHLSNANRQGDEKENEKKRKTNIIPKITLINVDEVSIVTLEEAQKISKRRDLKLVKIVDVDTKSQRPVYKLMSGTEYHEEELKQREKKKRDRENDNSLKGEKVLILNAAIGLNDLRVAGNRISKWLSRKYEARIIINGQAGNMEKAVSIFLHFVPSQQIITRFAPISIFVFFCFRKVCINFSKTI